MKFEIIDGNKLVIVLDVSPEALKGSTASKSGKSKVLATTHGFTSVQTPAGQVRLSLNAIV
jgi:hypothetical protein